MTANHEDSQEKKRQPQKKYRTLVVIIQMLALACFVVALVGVGGLWFAHSPTESVGREIEIVIAPGRAFKSVSDELEKHGVISSAMGFNIMAYLTKNAGKLQVGRFVVQSNWSPIQILTHLVSGKPHFDRITIPEGLPWWEVAKRLEQAGMVRFDDFATIIHDPTFLAHWGIPFPSAEGFLFPDTYLLMRPAEQNLNSARSIANRMVDTFWRRTASLWPNMERPKPNNAELVRNMVTLGSIIEKETAVASERKRVAGVYVNRLRRRMLLQADPTIIYGIGPSFTGSILRSQLNDTTNRYNTYKHPGLPPGPICSPGLASMEAAFEPEKHDFIYFVARGDGSHVFSKNLQDHNRAVRDYRRTLRQNKNPT